MPGTQSVCQKHEFDRQIIYQEQVQTHHLPCFVMDHQQQEYTLVYKDHA